MATQDPVENILNIDSYDSLKETPLQKLKAGAKMGTEASKQDDKYRKALQKENQKLRNENMCLAIHELFRVIQHLKMFLHCCSYHEHMSSTGTPAMGTHPVAHPSYALSSSLTDDMGISYYEHMFSTGTPPKGIHAMAMSPSYALSSSLPDDMGMYGLGPTISQQYTDPNRSSSISISADSRNAPSQVGEVAVRPEQYTTVMARNIPNNYTNTMLIDLLNEKGFKQKYDLVYMPLDFKKEVGLGYAFINFVDRDAADLFFKMFTGLSAWIGNSDKECVVTWSDAIQGRDANINRYRNSPIMHQSVPDVYKPVLFDRNGMPEAFPRPTKRIRPPREWRENL